MSQYPTVRPVISFTSISKSTTSVLKQCLHRMSRPSFISLSSVVLGIAVWCGSGLEAIAASPETAPPELTNLLTEIEAASNQRDVQAVLAFYGDNFTHSDGLSRSDLERALTQLWFEYPDLTYDTELQSWEPDGNGGWIAQTVTRIQGQREAEGRPMTLEATIESQQRYQNGQIVQQNILSEESQLRAGNNPPSVSVRLPDQVGIGQEFNFDVIVQEPLGDRLLLGSAIEKPVDASGYFEAPDLTLEVLPAGGIYKLGEAPATPDSHWVSAILIREDGITTVSQRLQVGSQTRQLGPTAGSNSR
jgi:hypothetical protein